MIRPYLLAPIYNRKAAVSLKTKKGGQHRKTFGKLDAENAISRSGMLCFLLFQPTVLWC